MATAKRILSWMLLLAGAALAAWTISVWQWQDPVTAVYTAHRQSQLRSDLRREAEAFVEQPAAKQSAAKARPAVVNPTAPTRASLERLATSFAARKSAGEPLGLLIIPSLGIQTVFVNGTNSRDLRAGPGRYEDAGMPGQQRLTYIAGHRTTFGAPFADLDKLSRGDTVMLELPYAVITYRVTGIRIVEANDLSVLRPGTRERLVLQACHPRFFATHRLLVDAVPDHVGPAPKHF